MAAGTPTPTATGGTGDAVAQIKANWNKFFNSSTPNSERVKLLQNGSQFTTSLNEFSSSPLAAAVSSKVDAVSLTSATKAAVTYDLTAMGASVASGAKGSSVLQDNVWKVGDDVFCSLLNQAKSAGLTLTVPAACNSVS